MKPSLPNFPAEDTGLSGLATSREICICSIRPIEAPREAEIELKALVASLGRSECGSEIVLLRNSDSPLFKIPRRQVSEITVTPPDPCLIAADSRSATRRFLLQIDEFIIPENHAWIIIMDPAGIALRNLDHLIPEDSPGQFAAPSVDFYWMPKDGSRTEATSGIWAVRGHLLREVLKRWNQLLKEIADPELAWSRTVAALPFRKKRFESGEVIAPSMSRMNWEAISSAAFVTVPDWPSEEQRKFLQSLYFGTYFGDSTGLMLNILES